MITSISIWNRLSQNMPWIIAAKAQRIATRELQKTYETTGELDPEASIVECRRIDAAWFECRSQIQH